MPVYTIDDIVGVIEPSGAVRCSDCINWTDDGVGEKDKPITEDDLQDGDTIYICDYCHKKL